MTPNDGVSPLTGMRVLIQVSEPWELVEAFPRGGAGGVVRAADEGSNCLVVEILKPPIARGLEWRHLSLKPRRSGERVSALRHGRSVSFNAARLPAAIDDCAELPRVVSKLRGPEFAILDVAPLGLDSP